MISETDKGLGISCYIRAFNEEERISRTVAAAKLVADEVVVVDSGSTDRTVGAAESAGARIVHQAWLGNGHQKRIGEEVCRHDWLLDLDADEVVSKELAEEIRALFTNGIPKGSVYAIPLTLVDPAGRVWRKSRSPRRAKLYDRRILRMPAHDVWDQLQIPGHVSVHRLDSPILHYALKNIAHLSRKQGDAMLRRREFLRIKSPFSTFCKVFIFFPFYFLKKYLVQGYWREGPYGFMCALVSAYNHWLHHASMYETHLLGTGETSNKRDSYRK